MEIMATETCPRCGGQGGEPGSNFGDYGWHPCFFCGETGEVSEGTTQRMIENEKDAAESDRWRPEYNEAMACSADYDYDGIGDELAQQADAKCMAEHGCTVKDFNRVYG